MTSTRPAARKATYEASYDLSGYLSEEEDDPSENLFHLDADTDYEDDQYFTNVSPQHEMQDTHGNVRPRNHNLEEGDDYRPVVGRKRAFDSFQDDDDFAAPDTGARHSARATRHKGAMEEKSVEDIYREDDEIQPTRTRALVVKEIFQETNEDFTHAHSQYCESCGLGNAFLPLIPCQGCSLSYHQECLGPRTSRQHLVTKVGEDDFILQCKHCSFVSKRGTDPDCSLCQTCHEPGLSCQSFRLRKTVAQEQQERADNDGVDPVTEVAPDLLDNLDTMLIRCDACFRAWHDDCLPQADAADDNDAAWICRLCSDTKAQKISNIIAWRPTDTSDVDADLAFSMVGEDEKEYLIKIDGVSYFHATWQPGAWVFRKASPATRNAFSKTSPKAKATTEAAIPEDYLTAEAVLAVQYMNGDARYGFATDSGRARHVSLALVKYKGLSYEQIFWDTPPPTDSKLWISFNTAYQDFVLGRYVQHSTPAKLAYDISSLRQQPFIQLREQPVMLTGGRLLSHQLKGLNWLLYKWYSKRNAILGDEMGLGKTIQVISMIVNLKQINCFPFLIVVPNSTVPNWKREFNTWAPSLKTCTFYGSKKARETIMQYELFPDNSAYLHCHVVIMSYEAAADVNALSAFRGIDWQGLVVDEGQRLKNDESQLYTALRKLRIPFRLLLTGTPLQNNPRELFNLLQFLDSSYNASKLEQQYGMEHLDAKKIEELHSIIRPHFLRRTKEQELKDLPTMKQIKLPVSMTLVQKKVYRTILTKDSALMRAILGANGSKPERASLSNIVMQLRKCLAHPFVYASDIEERMVDNGTAHKNLVEASPKLKLLEQMLPMLKAGGHRVLIFSQFLDMLTMLEDFLTGLGMQYQRLDGNITSLEKQRRIDHFNAPDSEDFAFLLSTRAGGVGINLATADTVIILDPDWNPHQDSQALARAHRIGQKKNVLCFKLMTIASVEERIMAIGERKLALDKALIQHIDQEDAPQSDLIAVLRHGVQEVFKDASDKDIVYDDDKLAALLDRSNVQNVDTASTADNAWSFAEEWMTNADGSTASNDQLVTLKEWKQIEGNLFKTMQEREKKAKSEAAKKAKSGRRGQRNRADPSYVGFKDLDDIEGLEDTSARAPALDVESDFSMHSDAESPEKARTAKKAEKPGKSIAKPVNKTGGRSARAAATKATSQISKSQVKKPRKQPVKPVLKATAKRGRPKKSEAIITAAVDAIEDSIGAKAAPVDKEPVINELGNVGVDADEDINMATAALSKDPVPESSEDVGQDARDRIGVATQARDAERAMASAEASA